MCIPVYPGTVTMTSPTRNIQVTFQGSFMLQSPTLNIRVNGKNLALSVNEMLAIRDIGNMLISPGPMGQVNFNITIQQ